MSSWTRLICLANSRKHGAHCVAGIEPASGQWLRPVSDLDDGRLPRHLRLVDGREPRLLEILELPLASIGPDFGFECENRTLLTGAWRSLGATTAAGVRRYCAEGEIILHTPERFVTVQHMQSLPPAHRRTLQLVETEEFTIFQTGRSMHGGYKWHGTLRSVGGAELTARITDPFFVEKLEHGYRPGPNCLITISLSMPYIPEDWTGDGTPCWKLIAAVLEMNDEYGTASGGLIVAPELHRNDVPPDADMDDDALAARLNSLFGYHSFREFQFEIVRSIVAGRDTFVVMPTGGGKSLCYQLPAALLEGVCVVISPLIALMKDQVDAANSTGLKAACFNSSQTRAERVKVLEQLEGGLLDLLYVSPERLVMEAFLYALQRARVCLFAVDEAHCISDWGHDFRPDYLFLGELLHQFPNVPIAAFTATATLKVEEDIISRLGLREPFKVRASFNRPNLFYEVRPKTDAASEILEFVRAHPGQCGIVYCATRNGVEHITRLLQDSGLRALPYHAGLDNEVRSRNQESFKRDEVEVIVATIAFGMGIDKPDVRYVIHADLPKNLESYYQETGRAGRDGAPAYCLLLFSSNDIPKQRWFIDQVEDPQEQTRLKRHLHEMIAFAQGNACRRRQLLQYFGDSYEEENCGNCDVCRSGQEQIDVTSEARLLLTAILDLGERFGAVQIADILCGAKTRRIAEWNLKNYSCYGQGSAHTKRYWRELLEALIGQKALRRSLAKYPVLSLLEKGHQIIRGELPFKILMPRLTEHDWLAVEVAGNAELFEELRAIRTRLAQEKDVPPFVIFSDRTLREMSTVMPVSIAELRGITGVGQVKMEAYGDDFLAVLRAFVNAHPEINPPSLVGAGAPGVLRLVDHRACRTSATLEQTWELLQQGLTVAEVAKARGLNESTVFQHMEKLILSGRMLDIDDHIAKAKQRQIQRLFAQVGHNSLGPVLEASQQTISYGEARLMRALALKSA